MKEEFLYKRGDKKVVLYAGLLDEVHGQGVKAIRVNILQFPHESNGNTCIAHCEVELADGRVFQDIADASPANVARMVAPHFIRMAATRAKTRTLRDALNINAVSQEELADEPDDHQPKHNGNMAAPASEQPTEREWAFYQALVRQAKELAEQGYAIEHKTFNDGETSRTELIEEGRALRERINAAKAQALVANKK